MIKSMTGFGKIIKSYKEFDISVEIKSVNSKYFDINFRLPKSISSLEIILRQPLQEILIRGKVDVRIDITIHTVTKVPSLNEELVSVYDNIFRRIAEIAKFEYEPKIEHFIRIPEVLNYDTDTSVDEILTKLTSQCVIECANELDEMRNNEGLILQSDIEQRLERLNENILIIDSFKDNVFEMWKEKFITRMENIGVSSKYEERIIQEASIMGEKANIAEEITRLKSHIEQFKHIMANEFPIGKKLDFLSQEIHRELNTIASKSSKQEIITVVIESKAESDKIREQIQNIV